MGPAGTVHAPLPALLSYFRLHLDPEGIGNTLLSVESLTRLHTPAPGTISASGWGAPQGGILTHAGSNGAWYCFIRLDVSQMLGVLTCTNAGVNEAISDGSGAELATEEDAAELLSTRAMAASL